MEVRSRALTFLLLLAESQVVEEDLRDLQFLLRPQGRRPRFDLRVLLRRHPCVGLSPRS